MYNLDTYNNYLNRSLPKAVSGGPNKWKKFLNLFKKKPVTPVNKSINYAESPVMQNDFLKLFKDRTHVNRFGVDYSGVDEYNSLMNLFKALPKHTAKPKKMIIDPLTGNPKGYNMEYYPKGDLYKNLSDNTFNNMYDNIIPDIQKQMKYLNKHGYYHGDIKLQNIVLDDKNTWKLIDPAGYPHASQLSSDMLKNIKHFEKDRLDFLSNEGYLNRLIINKSLSKDEGGELLKAGPGGKISGTSKLLEKLFKRIKNRKALPEPEFPLYQNSPVILGKNYGTPGNPFVYHRTPNKTSKLDWDFLNLGTTPGYLEKLGVKGTNTPGRYKGIWGFNSQYPAHANPFGGYEPWLGSRTLDAWGNPAGYGHRILQYQFKPDARILDLTNRSTSAAIKNAKHHQALIDKGYDAILGKNETILLNANKVDNVHEMRNLYDQEMLKNFPEMFPIFKKEGGDLSKANLGGPLINLLKKLIAKAPKNIEELKRIFSKIKKGDIILDKDLKLLHGSKNANLTLDDIKLIETYKALQSRQNSALRSIRKSKKAGTFVPGDELAGFYSSPYDRAVYPNAPQSIIDLNPKFTEGVSFQPVSFDSRVGYKFDLAKGSRIKDMSDLGTSSMTVRNLRRYLDEGYDAILGKDVTNSYEVLPLNKNKIINWEKVNPFNIFNPNKFDLRKGQEGMEYNQELPTANLGGPKKWIDTIKKIFGKTDDIIPKGLPNFNKIQDDLLKNEMRIVNQLKDESFQLPYIQNTFYHGSRDPNMIFKNIKKGRIGKSGRPVLTGYDEISPITGKHNMNLDQPGNATWWTPREGLAKSFHKHTYQADLSNIKNPYYMSTGSGNRVWSYDEMKQLMDEGYDAIIMNAMEKNPANWFTASEIIPLNKNVIQNVKKIQRKGGEQKNGIDKLLKNLEKYKNKITVTKNIKRNKKVGGEYYVEIPHPSIKNQKLRVGSVNTNNSGNINSINIKDKFNTMGINTLLHNLAG